MVIVGVLLHVLKGQLHKVRTLVDATPDFEVHSVQEEQYLVVVGELESDAVQVRLEELEKVDGVLAVYTTYAEEVD